MQRPAAARAKRFLERSLRRIDPNDDPAVEPISIPAATAILVAIGYSAFQFLRWKFHPMQDVGLHAGIAAVVADYGRKGSIYPTFYKPFDYLSANSLIYAITGLLSKVMPASVAFRITLSSYIWGLPLATLYALRVFGRSAWGTVAVVGFTFNQAFVFGFASYLCAAPLSVLSLPVFYRMLLNPTWKRTLAAGTVVLLLFFSHWHSFLWTGVLLLLLTVGTVVVSLPRYVLGRPTAPPWKMALAAAAAVLPSLVLLARWINRGMHPPADEVSAQGMQGASWAAYKAAVQAPSAMLKGAEGFYKTLLAGEQDRWIVASALALAVAVTAIRTLHRTKHPPVLELACVATMFSFLLMPEFFASQEVIASRQLGHALWFAPVFFTPVPWRVTALGRLFAIAAAIYVPVYQYAYWTPLLKRFQKEEVNGLEHVLGAAPPRMRLHYVNIQPQSKYFVLNSFWHIEKYYMLDGAGQCSETAANGPLQPLHLRSDVVRHRITQHSDDWPHLREIWDNYDLVLTHHWHPSPAQLAEAEQHGERLAKQGPWELWRTKGR